jgi:hypothetical protein
MKLIVNDKLTIVGNTIEEINQNYKRYFNIK